MSSTEDVFQIPVSPSVAARTAMLRKQGAYGPSGLASDALPHHFSMQNPRDSNDHNGEQEVRDTTNRDPGLGAIEKSGYSRSSVESEKSSGPPDTGAYKRFNGKEQKEREKSAESWISAIVKKRVASNRKASKPTIQVVNKVSFLYEYAVYRKDRSFIGNNR